MGGRQVGTWTTSAGSIPATGRDLVLRVIDLLTVTDGRITEILVVADELGALVALDAVRLRTPADSAVGDSAERGASRGAGRPAAVDCTVSQHRRLRLERSPGR